MVNNILARSFLLIPSGILIFFTPAFLDIEIDVFLLILLKFLNQSFKSLIVFNRKFKLNIGVESLFLVTLLLLVILEIEVLNLKVLIQLIVIALTVKFLTFLYFFIGDFKNTPINFQFKELKQVFAIFYSSCFRDIKIKSRYLLWSFIFQLYLTQQISNVN